MLPAHRLLASARSYAETAAGPAQMSFTFTLPVQVLYHGTTAKQVDVPTLSGSFGILAAPVPTLQVLKPGVVTVFAEDSTAAKYLVSSAIHFSLRPSIALCGGLPGAGCLSDGGVSLSLSLSLWCNAVFSALAA
uniref:ATP synthase F(1) complex subunit delta, mitochondrial n=1 Tax=Chelydra serpentina TaxID=8475 RepID=A0A8C3T2T8_CHESE